MPNMNWRTGEPISGVVGQSLGGCAEGITMYAIYKLKTDDGEAMVIMSRSGPLTEGTRIKAKIGTVRLNQKSNMANENHIIEVVDVSVQPSATILSLCRPGQMPQLTT